GWADPPRANAVANAQLPTPDVSSASWPRTVLPLPPDGGTPVSAGRSSSHRGQSQAVATLRDSERTSPIPMVGGPSFLGLSSDPQRDGEHLLDEERSSRGGPRRLV